MYGYDLSKLGQNARSQHYTINKKVFAPNTPGNEIPIRTLSFKVSGHTGSGVTNYASVRKNELVIIPNGHCTVTSHKG